MRGRGFPLLPAPAAVSGGRRAAGPALRGKGFPPLPAPAAVSGERRTAALRGRRPGLVWEGLPVASGSGNRVRWAEDGRSGFAREGLPTASGSASRVRWAEGGGPARAAARPCDEKGFPLLPAPAAVLRRRGAASPPLHARAMVLPARLRIFSVTLFHPQTSYCAEAGRAAFCGTTAAHLPNGNRFGGGVAVRQQGGDESRGGMRETAGKERALTITARSWRRSPRISSPLSFLRRLPTSLLSKPHLLQATGDHGNG